MSHETKNQNKEGISGDKEVGGIIEESALQHPPKPLDKQQNVLGVSEDQSIKNGPCSNGGNLSSMSIDEGESERQPLKGEWEYGDGSSCFPTESTWVHELIFFIWWFPIIKLYYV